ncbi:MAG: hypothetical protein JXM73_00790 [Anaerolineae bacterium]|nr:hypothetical protein [Anaerolineae bacterium]
MSKLDLATNHSHILLFTGRFGSGKTEVAINYALRLALAQPPASARPGTSAEAVILIDLDIVTPYFRSREIGAVRAMEEHGVRVVAPHAAGQHLDIPAITPQILGALQQSERPVVVDVGGDPQGARALGQFSGAIRQAMTEGRPYTMHFVVNPYRPFTNTLQGLAQSIAEIETTSRLKVSSLVSNPNLIGETTVQAIVDGHARIEEFAGELGLPIAFLCVERQWVQQVKAAMRHTGARPMLVLDRYFAMPWE